MSSVFYKIFYFKLAIWTLYVTDELKRVGLEDSPEEINVVVYDDEDMKYPMEPNEEFDSDVLSEFIEQYKNGLL